MIECKVCGHKKGHAWVDNANGIGGDYKEVNKEGEEFIRISGNFTITQEASYGPDRLIAISLWGCPCCKTVIMGGD